MALAIDTLEPAPLDARADEAMVRMRDGVLLATDVYLPDAPGRHPAVLVRLPYDKAGRYTFMPALAPHFTERGYAFVVQDVRGKFRSQGETLPFVHEVDDGYDTIDWVAGQPWCNGDVGMFGDSYYGFTQWAAVASGHPFLRAIVPRVTSADLGAVRPGAWWDAGVPPLYAAEYLANYWADNLVHQWPADWSHRPLAEVFDEGYRQLGVRSAGLDILLRGGQLEAYPGRHPFDRPPVPTLHCVGWFDNIGPFSMVDHAALLARPGWAPFQYLDCDSTDHENYWLAEVPVTPEADHDTDAAALARMIPRYLGPALDFLDVFVRGVGDASAYPRVRWHLGNADRRTSASWPPAEARELRLYASGDALAERPDAAAASVSWVHDPEDLVPSTVRDPFAFLREFPDERPVQARDDVVVFTSEPADRPRDLAGPVEARLAVETTGPSAQLHCKLCVVDPGGAPHMLTRGQALATGGVTVVRMGHTGYRLQPGHHLRLQIASSDFPLYVAHPGTDADPWHATRSEPTTQTLRTGAESYLSLTTV